MSIRREQINPTFEVFVGTKKQFLLTVIDPDTNEKKDLVDAAIYATGVAKIFKSDGTAVGADMAIVYEAPRSDGIISFIVLDTDHTLPANAGNWWGEVEFINNVAEIIDQQRFGINIIESY